MAARKQAYRVEYSAVTRSHGQIWQFCGAEIGGLTRKAFVVLYCFTLSVPASKSTPLMDSSRCKEGLCPLLSMCIYYDICSQHRPVLAMTYLIVAAESGSAAVHGLGCVTTASLSCRAESLTRPKLQCARLVAQDR